MYTADLTGQKYMIGNKLFLSLGKENKFEAFNNFFPWKYSPTNHTWKQSSYKPNAYGKWQRFIICFPNPLCVQHSPVPKHRGGNHN